LLIKPRLAVDGSGSGRSKTYRGKRRESLADLDDVTARRLRR
jgi:hypothetical protein